MVSLDTVELGSALPLNLRAEPSCFRKITVVGGVFEGRLSRFSDMTPAYLRSFISAARLVPAN